MEKTLKMKSKENDVQTEIETYFQQISKALPREGRKTLLPDIRAGVESYLAENPEAGIDDVVSYVGTPEDIAAEYYSNLDGGEITGEMKIGRKIVVIILLFVLAAAVIFGITLAIMLIYNNCFEHKMIKISSEVITGSDLSPVKSFGWICFR